MKKIFLALIMLGTSIGVFAQSTPSTSSPSSDKGMYYADLSSPFFVSGDGGVAVAQNVEKKNTLKLNVIGIFFGDGNIGYEKSLNNKNSIQFNTAFGLQTADGVRYQMNALALGYRYYFKGTTEKGWYVNPELGAARVQVKEGSLNFTSTSYLWRINGGWKRTYKSGFTLEFGAGIDGFGNNFDNKKYNLYNPIYPYLNTGIAYSF